MVQRSGRFKTAHTGCYLSAKAYRAVRRFETALYRALLRGQSKKRYLHALYYSEFLRSLWQKQRNEDANVFKVLNIIDQGYYFFGPVFWHGLCGVVDAIPEALLMLLLR